MIKSQLMLESLYPTNRQKKFKKKWKILYYPSPSYYYITYINDVMKTRTRLCSEIV